MEVTLSLEYTPRGPVAGLPFTECGFVRRTVQKTFRADEIGLALVDVWNFGWEGGPVVPALGPELSLERGVSHAQRKRQIVEERIVPAVGALRRVGIQVFHCTHWDILARYPQWLDSTTEEEREAARRPRSAAPPPPGPDSAAWPPPDWVHSWREEHRDLVYNIAWMDAQRQLPPFDLAPPVRPVAGDLLVCAREQFHRLLTERGTRMLLYMGFETDECLQFKPYGIANMQALGYLCVVVRDCTTTYENAETFAGLWKTHIAVEAIEARWGYSTTSGAVCVVVRAAGAGSSS
jgi:nicotinamidase-related amidase